MLSNRSEYILGVPYDEAVNWVSGGETLALDEDILNNDPKLEVRKESDRSTLVITQVEPQYSKKFTCTLLGSDISVTHEVVVVSAPSVVITPDASEYTVRKGESVLLRCLASGNPKPLVHWTKKAGQLEEDVIQRTDGTLSFVADSAHQGVYICTARNKIGEKWKSIDVKVNVKPWVRTEEGYIPVGYLDSTNISCTFDGNPPPNLEWYYNGYRVKLNDEKFMDAKEWEQREQNYTRTTLELHRMNQDVFGDYICQASNNLGTARAVVHVSGKPGPPELDVAGSVLKWSVRSRSPIIEYAVKFRLRSHDIFNGKHTVSADKKDRTGSDEYSSSVDLATFLQKGKAYEVQVEARNAMGWGSMARKFQTIEVPGEDNGTF
ncbi:unnamed protein product, partial [Mesorhabditis spiculigera]